MSKAFVIPVEGDCYFTDVPDGDSLAILQGIVGGYIEALGLPEFIVDSDTATAYINEEGKLDGSAPNMRATDFMVPGVGLFFGDYIAGPMVLLGFDSATGGHTDVPEAIVKRARLIQGEAG